MLGEGIKVDDDQTKQALTVIDRNHDGKVNRMELFLTFQHISKEHKEIQKRSSELKVIL